MKTYEILLWVALAIAAIGGWLIHPAIACFIVAAAIAALGLMLALEPTPEPYEAPEGLDALNTASPESDA